MTASHGNRAVGLVVGALAGLLAKELNLALLVSYWDDTAPLAVAGAVIGALLWPTRLKSALQGATVALAVLWLAVAFTPLSRWLAADLVRRDPIGPADAVVVLASRIQADGELTSASMSRLMRGLELIGEGHTHRLVLTELHPPERPYAETARRLMKSLGMEAEVVALGPVGNTRDEAVVVARHGRKAGWTRILLVTSPTHTRRAQGAFAHEGLTVLAAPAMEVRYDVENLSEPRDRVNAFGGILHEWMGLWVYRHRGWLQ